MRIAAWVAVLWMIVGTAAGALAQDYDLTQGIWRRTDGMEIRFVPAGDRYQTILVTLQPGTGHLFKVGESLGDAGPVTGKTFKGTGTFRNGQEERRPEYTATFGDINTYNTTFAESYTRVPPLPEAGAGAGGAGAGGNPFELEGTWKRLSDNHVVTFTRNGQDYVGTIVEPTSVAHLFKPGDKTFDVKRVSGNTFKGKVAFRPSPDVTEWRDDTIVMSDANGFSNVGGPWIRVDVAAARGCDRTFAKAWDPTTWGRIVITVEGTKASGSYTSRYQRLSGGTFTGSVSGNQLTADWRDNDGEGTLTLTLTDDGCSFAGKHTVTRSAGAGNGAGTGAGAAGGAGSPDPGGRDIGMANAGGLVNGLPAEPCSDPETQKCIQKWMDLMIEIRNRRDKSPQGQGGPWRFSEYGTLLGHSVVAAYAPDGWETKYKRSKYCVVWEIWQQAHLDPLHGNELPALADYVRGCYASMPRPAAGAGSSAGAGATGAGASNNAGGRLPEVTGMTLHAESRRVPTGERVSVPVWLLKGTDVANLNLIVTYDPTVVRIEGEPGKGNLLSGALFSANAGETGVVRVGFAQRTGISGDGTVATLPFRTTGTVGARSPITLEVGSINNAAGATPRVDVLHGEIVIVGADGMLPGDSDGDGRVTELDALLALKMSVKLIDPSLTLDLDADRQVTSRDSVLILQQAVQPR